MAPLIKSLDNLTKCVINLKDSKKITGESEHQEFLC